MSLSVKSGAGLPPSKEVRSLVITTAILSCLVGNTAYAQKSQVTNERRNLSVEVFQVPDLPLNVHEAVLLPKGFNYVLRCRVANDASSEIVGFRFTLTWIDAMGGLHLGINRTEALKLDAYETQTLTFASPIKYSGRQGDRFVLMVEQVLSAEDIWEVIKAKDALEAYAKGDYSSQPKVMRVTNQVDAPSPSRVIPIRLIP